METGEQWVRNLLKTRGQVPGLDQFIQCPDPKKFDDCIDLLEPLITTMESEVMKMHRNVDKSTKRKYAMDRDTINYITPDEAESALVTALTEQLPLRRCLDGL